MRSRGRLLALLGVVLLLGCSGSGSGPQDLVVEGVDFTRLFAPPSQAEIDAILAEWAGRQPQAQDVNVVATTSLGLGAVDVTVHVVSHVVDGPRHYGAILVPDGALPGSLPILMYAHGGDGGVDIDQVVPFLPFILGSGIDDFVIAIPSFRAEPLTFDGTTYVSDGPPSPWDRDVDDALALLDVVAGLTPEADPARIGILGFSRGACVALLMAIREPSIDLVVEFFGPTDFFGPFVQQVVAEALRGNPRGLPGLAHLDQELIQPLKSGQLTIEDVRPEILRRSPVYFADRLPQVQVHHGTDDTVVPVGEAERLIAVMAALGRRAPEFEFYLYPGGGHDPLTLPGSIPRTVSFLDRLR
ncbi:MAG: alpha/beta hydrolase family protein [Planctomycetota bacterium]